MYTLDTNVIIYYLQNDPRAFKKLKDIAEELSTDDIGIDSLISKGKEASEAAKICIKILKTEKSNFKTLEEELLSISDEIDEL